MDEEKKKSLCLFGCLSTLGSNCGLAFAVSPSDWSPPSSLLSARLAVKSKELAEYFGNQFIDIWSDYLSLPRKEYE